VGRIIRGARPGVDALIYPIREKIDFNFLGKLPSCVRFPCDLWSYLFVVSMSLLLSPGAA
jgi:hypothetical protein